MPQPRPFAVAEPREHAALVGAHPFDRRRLDHVRTRDHQVQFAAYAGELLQGGEVAQRGHALRHELGDIGLHGRQARQSPPHRRADAPDREHQPRSARHALQRKPPDAVDQRVLAHELLRATPCGGKAAEIRATTQRTRATTQPSTRKRHAGTAHGHGAHERNRQPNHKQQREVAHHRHRRELQHEHGAGARGSRSDDRRASGAGGRNRRAVHVKAAPGERFLDPRLELDRVVDGQPDQDRQHRDLRPRQRAPPSASTPKVIAVESNAQASGSRRRRSGRPEPSTIAITSIAPRSSSTRVRDELPIRPRHRGAGDEVCLAAVKAPLRHRHRFADRPIALRSGACSVPASAAPRSGPRRCREQVGETLLGVPGTWRRCRRRGWRRIPSLRLGGLVMPSDRKRSRLQPRRFV